MPDEAIISMPPFKIVGTIHLLPTEGDLRQALAELTGRFLPVTDATYWSDLLGEARQTVAPGRGEPPARADPGAAQAVDPWAGIDPSPGQAPASPPSPLDPDYDPTQPDDRIR